MILKLFHYADYILKLSVMLKPMCTNIQIIKLSFPKVPSASSQKVFKICLHTVIAPCNHCGL